MPDPVKTLPPIILPLVLTMPVPTNIFPLLILPVVDIVLLPNALRRVVTLELLYVSGNPVN